jgi:hypothetical protein
MYYVSWVGWGQEHNEWKLAKDLACNKLIQDFWEKKKKKEGKIGQGGAKKRETPTRDAKTQVSGGGNSRTNKWRKTKDEEVFDLEYEDSESEGEVIRSKYPLYFFICILFMFYFILFYFISFHFILFYFILFILFYYIIFYYILLYFIF